MSEHKHALVTGASRGIGRSIAIELAKAGFSVIGTATGAEGIKLIDDYAHEEGVIIQSVILDVSHHDGIEGWFAQLEKKVGIISVLVNNAGITRDNLLLRMKRTQWDEVINTNLTGTHLLTQRAVKKMLKQRFGRIINITSVVALSGNSGQANYAASKAGIIAYSKTLALELASRGITVNCVAPGLVKTDMTQAMDESMLESLVAAIPMGEMGEPDDIAHAVNFLASDKANYITGQTINVNGGMLMI